MAYHCRTCEGIVVDGYCGTCKTHDLVHREQETPKPLREVRNMDARCSNCPLGVPAPPSLKDISCYESPIIINKSRNHWCSRHPHFWNLQEIE